MTPHKLKGIFRHGHSSKERGSGFGLHSAATFVQSRGGTVAAQSEGKSSGVAFVLTWSVKIS